MFWGAEAKLRPQPARIAVLPLVPGDHARPTLGAKFRYWFAGELNSRTPGTLASEFQTWRRAPSGMVVSSYRTPALITRFGRTLHSSCANKAWLKEFPLYGTDPTERRPFSGVMSIRKRSSELYS